MKWQRNQEMSHFYFIDRGILYATIPEFLTGTNIKALFTFIYFVSFSVITLAQHVSFSYYCAYAAHA